MERYKYRDYRQYVIDQRRGYQKKRTRVWMKPECIEMICAGLKLELPENPAIICHGARTGAEVLEFRKVFPNVAGTDIGGAISDLVVRWDFNIKNPQWIGRFDLVYSNALDHSWDPGKTLDVWKGQLKAGGILVVEWAPGHTHNGSSSKKANRTDPVGMTVKELRRLLISRFGVVQVVKLSRKHVVVVGVSGG
ncbi:hypothetical protein LCGC14_3026950 [marine sediment metagenome]|uniref:Methyltransferase type 11 domain-containing protein n=1 Tax=marine sediment metagenome TaxID=412755 RepID=A0A0F8WTX7_9ZZZZ